MMIKKIFTLLIASSLLSVCTMPVFAINTVQKNENKTEKIKKTKKTDKLKSPQNKLDYINISWWENFNDEYLTSYIVRAVENNKDLNMATLAVGEYYQAVKAQRANEFPALYTGFLPAYANMSGHAQGLFALPVFANYEVDLWGKNHNKTTSVKKLWEVSILDEQAAYISVASAVGSAYINIVKLDAMIDIQSDIVQLRKEIAEMMDIANKEGIVSTSDLVKANKSYVAGVSSLTELQKNRTKMLHALAVLIGDSPNNIEEYKRIDYKTLSYKGTLPTEVNSEIIMKRPDYLKAEKMLEKAGIDVRIARKEMCPSIILGGGVFFNNKYLESLFTTSNMLWGLGGGIIQPAFLGGKLKANLKMKKIAYERSVKNYEKVNLTSMQEVNDTLVSANMDREKLNKQKEIQAFEQKDYKLSQDKFNEGVISKLDLNQMEENLLMVNEMVYLTQFDCMIDYISYYKATAAQNM